MRLIALVAALLMASLGAAPVFAQNSEDGGIYTVPRKPKPRPQEPAATPPQQPQQTPATRPQQPQTSQPRPQTPQQQAPQQAQPRPAQPPADVTERVLTRRLGNEGFERARQQMQNMANEAANGRGAPMADRWFDGAGSRAGAPADPVSPSGTPFFQGSRAPVRVTPDYSRSTGQEAQRTIQQYGSQPGGVVLEGAASGLGRIGRVRYDPRFNAFVIDERAVYFMKIPPKTVALLLRALAEDDNVGVSLGDTHIVYGKIPEDSELAMDLKIADHFLGDIVFAQGEVTAGYRFAGGFRPQPNQAQTPGVAVFFKFTGFQFQVQQEEVRLVNSGFSVRLVPLSATASPQGGHLPDMDAIARWRVSPQYEANARHVADNIDYYRRERIIDRTFAYGEVAAFIRAMKQSGVDLRALARSIPAGR